MTFLNASLIFGLVAATIPIVLHLLSKREPKTVVFPAVRFLTQRYQSNRSRLQVRRWWLLALRILAIAAVALTLARPVILRSLSTTWLSIGIVSLLGLALLVMAGVAYSSGHAKRLSQSLLVGAVCVLFVTTIWGGITAARGPAINVDAMSPAAVAIVIDNSVTSGWTDEGESLLTRHVNAAVELVSQLAPSSRVAILDRSAEPASFSLDVSSAIAKAESLGPREVTTSIGSRLDAAIRLVRTSELENRHVFVVSDFAAATWEDATGSVSAMLSQSESPVAITLVNHASFSGVNRHLSLPKVSDDTPPRQTPTPVAITVGLDLASESIDKQSSADEDVAADVSTTNVNLATSVTVEMLLYKSDRALPVLQNGNIVLPDTVSVDRTSVRLAPGQAAEVVLTIPPLEVGTHHGIVRLVGSDPLALDDVRYFTVRVLKSSPLLVVGSVPEETRLVSQAITAPFSWDASEAEFAIDRIAYDDFLAARLSDYDGVVLLDPPAEILTDASLEAYGRGGGGLLICLGPSAKANASPSSIMPELVRPWRVPGAGTFLQTDRPSHPVLAWTGELAGGVPWNQYPIEQYWQLETGANDVVLMQYASTAHVALVERSLGPPQTTGSSASSTEPLNATFGRSLVLTTPIPALSNATRGWNQLFSNDAWPAFLLLREMVGYVTGRDSEATTTGLGQPHRTTFERITDPQAPGVQDASLDENATVSDESREAMRRIQLFAPGRSNAIPITVAESAEHVLVTEVDRSGTYWMRGGDRTAGFSANVSLDTINTGVVGVEKWNEWFGAEQYDVVKSPSEIDLSRGGQTPSVMLQSPAMLLALVIFLLEQILSNRFYRHSASGWSRTPAAPRSGAASA